MLHTIYYCLILWCSIRSTYQQDSADDGDPCSFISGQKCDNGVCKYCAMCLQNSCILNKSISFNNTNNPICNTIQFGNSSIYDWYGYCLSSGNDDNGEYCETRTHCYQYLQTNHTSTISNIWRNLTCDADTCVMVTNNGNPPPTPPLDDPSATSQHHHHSTHSISSHSTGTGKHSTTVIILSVTCTLIFVGLLVWVIRFWKQSSYWPPPCLKKHLPSSMYLTYPISELPSFRSITSEMTSRQQQQQIQRSSSSSINSNFGDEPLPSYFSRDPSPPKYEHAIVTQIRGLLEVYHQNGASSSTTTDDYDDYHDNTLPPPMWVPIYFAPNRTYFSLGRLRRHSQHHQPSRENDSSTCQRHDPSTITNEYDLGSSSAVSTSSASFTS